MEQEATVLISFDGFDPKSYGLLRGMPSALDLKLKALENLSQANRGKVIIMTVVSKEQDIGEFKKLLAYCLEHQRLVRGIFLMPLAHMWSPERLDYAPERTTPEDVEEMVNRVVGGGAEFVPMGSLDLAPFFKVLNWRNAPFVGVHPNCESINFLISDGEKLYPISAFLRHGLFGLVKELRESARKITAFTGPAWRLKLKTTLALAGAVLRHYDFGAAVGKKGIPALLVWMRIFGKVLLGKRLKDVLRAETKLKRVLQIIILPFEDYDTSEGIRLKPCASSFVYINSPNGDIRYIPVCAWERNKKAIMKDMAERFNKPGYTRGLSKEAHVATTN
jgi:uncharacterized radical SAM superfamily Fe-S cluster-containing enzyme